MLPSPLPLESFDGAAALDFELFLPAQTRITAWDEIKRLSLTPTRHRDIDLDLPEPAHQPAVWQRKRKLVYYFKIHAQARLLRIVNCLPRDDSS
jgi:hypothetical protein